MRATGAAWRTRRRRRRPGVAAALDDTRCGARQASRHENMADEALRELGTLEQTEPHTGDEAVRDELTRRAGGYVQADVDGWLAHPSRREPRALP